MVRLRRACLAVTKDGVSRNRACKFYRVGKKSLRRALQIVDGENIDNVDLPKRGRPTYLSSEMTWRLVRETYILDAMDHQSTPDMLRQRMKELKAVQLEQDADPEQLPNAPPSQPALSTVRLFSQAHGLNVIKVRNSPAGNTAGSKATEEYLVPYFDSVGQVLLNNKIQPEDV